MSLLSEMSSLNPSVDLMELHSMGRPSLDLHSTQPFLELEAPFVRSPCTLFESQLQASQ